MSTTKELRVVSVQVKNVLGIVERAIEPDGRSVIVSGPNASGKTSLLRALESTLAGGSLARLQRVGAEEPPEVVLVLEGTGGHYRVKKRGGETAKVSVRVGDTAAFEDVVRPQEFLSGLFDPAAANPVRFLLASDKDRARLLLEAIPLKMDQAQLLREMGLEAAEVPQIPASLHPLEALALIREDVFRKRTGVNRDQKSAAAAAEQLRRNTPAVLPEDPKAAINALEGEVASHAGELGARETQAKATHREALASANSDHAAEEAAIGAAFKLAAAEIRARAEKEIADRKAADDVLLEELDRARRARVTAADEALAEAGRDLGALRNTLAAKREHLAALRAQADTAAKALALKAQTQEFDAHADRLEAESERLTAALAALDAYTRRLGESLPIPGLAIEGKEIKRDGVPFDQLNDGQQVEIAAAVAELRAAENPLKVVFLDGLETLDSQRRAALLQHLAAKGIQAFGAVVTDGDPDVAYVGAVTEQVA